MGDDDDRGQSHVHEFAGSTLVVDDYGESHNHRFTGSTSEVLPYEDSHVHGILVNTDIFGDHLHEVSVRTSPAIAVGPHKHVHFVCGTTTADNRHCHRFVFATQIEDPLEWDG